MCNINIPESNNRSLQIVADPAKNPSRSRSLGRTPPNSRRLLEIVGFVIFCLAIVMGGMMAEGGTNPILAGILGILTGYIGIFAIAFGISVK
jgi:hypothetical protein